MKPKFKQRSKEDDYSMLQKKVEKMIKEVNTEKLNAQVLIKGIFIMVVFVFGILFLWNDPENPAWHYLTTMGLGVLCVPIILVIGHEAIHGNFTNNKKINQLGEYVFTFLGTSAYFWRLRHLNAHHYYTNVRNWDLDIEQSNLIRLNAGQKFYGFHKFQYIYMPFLFMLYTFNWFFIRDLKDLNAKQFGTKYIKNHPMLEVVLLAVSKVWHFSFLIFIPLSFGQELSVVLTGFLIFHVTASLTTTLVLVSTHVGESQELMHVEPEQNLPYSWVEHQIRTSGNFSTGSSFALNFFGGFNHHLTHHLFPSVPYSLYVNITPLIQKYCAENSLPYYNYPNLGACISSHFKRLKQFSKP